MPDIGTAYVQIVPKAEGISGSITNLMSGEATKAGKSAGGKFTKALGTAAKGAAVAGAAISAGFGVAVAGIKKGISDTAAFGDNVDKMSQKLGLSAESYQKWDYVMNLAGTDMQSMTTGLKTLTNKLDDAQNGSGKAQEMFSKLGISLDDMKNMSREDLFGAAIQGLQGMEDSTERAALANDLFGKSGQNLTPLFNQSAEATKEQMELAEKYGMVMSNDAVKASAAFQDSVTTMQMTLGGLKNSMMTEFLPAATKVTDGLGKMFSGDMSGMDDVVEGIKEVMAKVADMAPKFLDAGGKLIGSLVNGLMSKAGDLGKKAGELIGPVINKIVQKAPDFIKAAAKLIGGLVSGLLKALPEIAKTVGDIVGKMVKWLLDGGWKDIGSKILKLVIDGISSVLSALKEIVTRVGKSILEGFGLDKLWQKVKDTVDKIKKFFNFKVSLPHIKLPHFTISPSGWELGDLLKGSIPSLSISWYKKAMDSPYVMTKPTLFGAGEAGDEMIYGRANLMRDIKEATGGGTTANFYVNVDGADDPEEWADRLVRRLKMDMRTA